MIYDGRVANLVFKEDLPTFFPEGTPAVLDWLCEPGPLKMLAAALECRLALSDGSEIAARRFALRHTARGKEAGGTLVVCASAGQASLADLAHLREMASSSPQPYAAALVAARIGPALRNRICALNDEVNPKAVRHFGLQLHVTCPDEATARMHLVCGHECMPERKRAPNPAKVNFWLQVEDALKSQGFSDAFASDDGSGVLLPLGWARNAVHVRAQMLKGELAAVVSISLASYAGEDFLNKAMSQLGDYAKQASVLSNIRCDRIWRGARLVVSVGKPERTNDPATWRKHREQLVLAAGSLARAVDPLVEEFRPKKRTPWFARRYRF